MTLSATDCCISRLAYGGKRQHVGVAESFRNWKNSQLTFPDQLMTRCSAVTHLDLSQPPNDPHPEVQNRQVDVQSLFLQARNDGYLNTSAFIVLLVSICPPIITCTTSNFQIAFSCFSSKRGEDSVEMALMMSMDVSE
jgi:hypothetical protein